MKTSVCADIDGDGLAEILVFYAKSATDTSLYFRVYKNGSFTTEATVTGLTLSGKGFTEWTGSRKGIGTPWFPYLSCCKANFSGTSGDDEILLADYNTVYILSVTDSGSASIIGSRTYTDSSSNPIPVSCVAAGDVNGDGKDEFVVGLAGGTSGAQYALYSGSFSTPITNPEITTLDSNGTFVEAAFGDFDGNNLDQLALCSTDSSGNVEAHMYDFTISGSSFTVNAQSMALTVNDNKLGDVNSGSNDYFRMLPRAVNLSGSGTDYLQVLGWIFTSPMTATTSQTIWSSFTNTGDNTLVDVQVGDVDNDGKQDLIYLSCGENGNSTIQVFGLNTSNTLANKKVLINASSGSSKYTFNNFGIGTTIAAGNFEDNSARVHYVGHSLTFTDPIVVAVLASTPYWSSVAQAVSGYAGAYPNWVTTFGRTQSSETDKSNAVGFSVGVSVEYEHDVNVPILGLTVAKFKASAAFNTTTSWQWTTSYNVSKTIQWSCPGGEDEVIFTAVPLDEYQYMIDYSTDTVNNPVGKSLYISIPRTYSTYQVTRDFFNANIGSGVIPPIDTTVMSHTLGSPKTYPSVTQKNNLLSKYFSSTTDQSTYQYPAQPVTQGAADGSSGGTTSLQITVTTGSSETITHDFSLDTSVGAGIGDWTTSLTAGFDTNYSATSTTSAGTTFGGTVGYLPATYYNNANYSYLAGLFAYPYKLATGKSFWVVDYWVQ